MAFPILPQNPAAYDGRYPKDWVDNRRGTMALLRHRSQAAALSSLAPGAGRRMASLLAVLAGFGLVALVLHEFFHFVVMAALGGDGYITFDWQLGLTHFSQAPDHLWAVQLGGGLLTGAFFLLVFWYWGWSSRTGHDTNIEVAAFAWALGSIAYAPTELVADAPTLGLTAFAAGFSVAVVAYFVKLMDWIAGPA